MKNLYESIHGSKTGKVEELYRISLRMTELKITPEQARELCEQIDNLVTGYIINLREQE